jgi:hypothetical protein
VPETKKRKRDDLVDPTPEQLEKEYDEIRALLPLPEAPKKAKQGKGKEHFLLKGVRQETGDRILSIVGLRMQNFNDRKIADFLHTFQPEIARLERDYPLVFERAESYLLKNAARKHNVLVWGIRHELTKYATRMIKVLVELAEDGNTKENIRHKAAVDVLNMVTSGSARQTYGGEEQQLRRGAIQVVQNTFKNDPDVALEVEAEDVTYTESEDEG